MKYIVSISGGLGSAEALKRTIERYGRDNTLAVFADVKGTGLSHDFFYSQLVEKPYRPYWFSQAKIDQLLHERFGGESRDTYRFIWRLAHYFDIPVTRLESDKTIWTQFAISRAMRIYTGKNFYCPASEILKREQIVNWINDQYWTHYAIVLGMGWDEPQRVEAARHWWSTRLGRPIEILAPNAEKPYADNCNTAAWLNAAGIDLPRAYEENFDHNNCNRGCVHAGQGHFANLYLVDRETYLYWAYMEFQIQRYLGKFVTILKDQRGGTTTPLSLYDFIPRIESGDYRKRDIGGCGCFVNSAMTEFISQAKIG